MTESHASCAVLVSLLPLLVLGCGEPEEAGSGRPGASESDTTETAAVRPVIAFANHCSATSPDVTLVAPAEAGEWRESEAAYCVVFEDTPEYYGGFDPLGLEGPCGASDSVPVWESSKELYAVVSGSDEATYTLHIATRIEETEDERCVGCYPEEAGCTGTSRFRDLSRDVSLTTPQGGGRRVVPLTEIQELDYAGEVLSLELAIELFAGDSAVARDTLRPVWPRCC
ncbi:MAG: hypothetical protein ACREMD_03310 [Gemmatimonadota bacterium]